jgi:hypothetical protein
VSGGANPSSSKFGTWQTQTATILKTFQIAKDAVDGTEALAKIGACDMILNCLVKGQKENVMSSRDMDTLLHESLEILTCVQEKHGNDSLSIPLQEELISALSTQSSLSTLKLGVSFFRHYVPDAINIFKALCSNDDDSEAPTKNTMSSSFALKVLSVAVIDSYPLTKELLCKHGVIEDMLALIGKKNVPSSISKHDHATLALAIARVSENDDSKSLEHRANYLQSSIREILNLSTQDMTPKMSAHAAAIFASCARLMPQLTKSENGNKTLAQVFASDLCKLVFSSNESHLLLLMDEVSTSSILNIFSHLHINDEDGAENEKYAADLKNLAKKSSGFA